MSPAATVPMVADLRSKASRTLTRTVGTKGHFFYQASQGELAVVEHVSAAAFFSDNGILARQRGHDARFETGAETALATPPSNRCRICGVSLDGSLTGSVDALKREQSIAISDLLEENSFAPIGDINGPYRLCLALVETRLILTIVTERGAHVLGYHLSLKRFRGLFKDYSLICESYVNAMARSTPDRLQALDMGRRAMHDEGAELLQERLSSNVTIDKDTARRLFTLIYLLLGRNAGGQF